MSTLLNKLEFIKERWEKVELQLSDPDVIADMKRFIKLNKEYSDLGTIVKVYLEYKDLLGNLDSTKEMLQTEKDEEMRDMAKEELNELEQAIPEIEESDFVRWLDLFEDTARHELGDEKADVFNTLARRIRLSLWMGIDMQRNPLTPRS